MPFQQLPRILQNWQDFFRRLYGPRNKERNLKDIVLHLAGRAAHLVKLLRKEEYADIGEHLAFIFAWLCAVPTLNSHALIAIVWHKYPGACPYCSKQERCVCIGMPKEERLEPDDAIIQGLRSQRDRMPRSLEGWQRMFKTIYGGVNQAQAQFQIGLHLVEEMCELIGVVDHQAQLVIEEEVADVFAWIVALANRLDINLQNELVRVFRNGCPVCSQEVCICK